MVFRYPASDLLNTNISSVIIGDDNDREVFNRAALAMTSDESSYRVRFLTSKRQPPPFSNGSTDSLALHDDTIYSQKQVDAVAAAAAAVLSPNTIDARNEPTLGSSSDIVLSSSPTSLGHSPMSTSSPSIIPQSHNSKTNRPSSPFLLSTSGSVSPNTKTTPVTSHTPQHHPLQLVSNTLGSSTKSFEKDHEAMDTDINIGGHTDEEDDDHDIEDVSIDIDDSLHNNTIEIHPSNISKQQTTRFLGTSREEYDERIIEEDEELDDVVEIEAQGVLIYHKITGDPSHVCSIKFTNPHPLF